MLRLIPRQNPDMTGRLTPRLLLIGLAVCASGALAHEGHEHEDAPAVSTGSVASPALGVHGSRLADGSVFLPKPAQFRLGLKSLIVAPASNADTVQLAAEVIPDPSHSARIASIERGLLMPPPGGFKRIGETVRRGDVVAVVDPMMETAELIHRRAMMASTEQELIINEQAMEQLGMRMKNQVALSTSNLYQKNLMGDRERLEGKLRSVRASIASKVTLRAPVSGEISQARVQIGALVEPGDLVYEILDPARLWVEARSFERIAPDSIVSAHAVTRNGARLPLQFMGQGLSANEQSLPLEFTVNAGQDSLRVGERLNVELRLKDAVSGLVLPQSSIYRSTEGRSRVWIQSGAERFTPRAVDVDALPGKRVRVRSGLAAGERVVAQGGWLLEQVR